MERLNMVSSIIDRCIAFNNSVYIPDVIAIRCFSRDWLYGGGLSSQSVLAYGDMPNQVTSFLRTMDLPVEALFSTLDRTAARALESE